MSPLSSPLARFERVESPWAGGSYQQAWSDRSVVSQTKWSQWTKCIVYWLVVSTPLKNMTSSVGMIIPNIWKIKFMFQTTNQLLWMVLRCLKCLQLFTPWWEGTLRNFLKVWIIKETELLYPVVTPPTSSIAVPSISNYPVASVGEPPAIGGANSISNLHGV